MSYNYVVTAQKPTAVNGCVTGEAAPAGDPGEGGNPGLGRLAAPGAAGARLGPRAWKALAAAERPSQLATLKELFHHEPFGQCKLLLRVPFAHRRSLSFENRPRPGGTESEVLSCVCMLIEPRNWPHVVRGKGEMIMGTWDQNFPVVVREEEEFELFLHPPQKGEQPSPDPPFCLGGGVVYSRALLENEVWLASQCAGSRQAITPPTKEYSSSTHISR